MQNIEAFVSAASLQAILSGLNPKPMLTTALLKLSIVYRQVHLMNCLLHEEKLKVSTDFKSRQALSRRLH